MRLRNAILLFLVLYTPQQSAYAQDSSLYAKLHSLPDKFFSKISAKADAVEQKLTRQTEKYLNRLAKQEKKLYQKLWRKDSTAAKELFRDIDNRYKKLQQSFTSGQLYSGRLDSMQTALRFLDQTNLLNQSLTAKEKLQSALGSYSRLQGKLNQTNEIKKQLKERQEYLKQHLQKFGLTKQFKQFQKDVYYYRAQVDEYRRMWEDPLKLEATLLRLANKIPAFRDFFSRHSMLAGMFRLPGNTPASSAPIPGLQTRSSVQQVMLSRFGSGPDVRQAVQQNIQSAQAQINQLKDKVNNLGGGNSDMDMPDFKPNRQRTKSFWQRIELGANMQSVRSNRFFPVTSDMALSAGYKLNDKSIIGIGASYKMGWGESIRRISITHQGIGFRSFVEIKLKGSFWVAGGGELNYRSRVHDFQILKDYSAWQQSVLIGISKHYRINAKFKGNVQLLFDALHAQHIPRAQPILFRVGYLLK